MNLGIAKGAAYLTAITSSYAVMLSTGLMSIKIGG